MSSASENAAWRATMTAALPAITAQGGGVLSLFVVRPIDAPELLGASMAGDANATRLMQVVSQTIAGIERAPRRRPMLCGSCPRPLRTGYAVVAALPAVAVPSQGLCLAICTRCGRTPAEIQEKAVRALRRLWPDSRPFTVHAHRRGARVNPGEATAARRAIPLRPAAPAIAWHVDDACS